MAETSKEPWQSRNRFAVPKACVAKLSVEEYKLELLWIMIGKAGSSSIVAYRKSNAVPCRC